MPRWIERRGFTLRVPGHPKGTQHPGRFVRLSLVECGGFFSGFNVREARAEPADDGTIHVAAAGRTLSWRPLGKHDADRLLEERLTALETMGYTVVDSAIASRGRWDWLYDLVNRQLHAAKTATATAAPTDALRDAFADLGLSATAVREGVAAVLGISVPALIEADPKVARDVPAPQLAALLPFLAHHDSREVREICARWLSRPVVLFGLPASTLLHWLESDAALADLLRDKVQQQGLALLGPERLVRLSRTGDPCVREAAKTWARRLHG